MKHLIAIITLSITIAFFSPSGFASEENNKEGSIILQEYSHGDDINKKNLITLGEKVIFEINAYIDDFLGEPIINANARIINKTASTMQVIYLIKFYDSAGNIVGASAMASTLEPNKDVYYGSALVRGKKEDFAKVTKYKAYACSYETLPKKE
ncbi:MAG: hypothetical protein WC546_03425 [Candidatus Omnitrophota bacterium]